jgi:hypothetical protein
LELGSITSPYPKPVLLALPGLLLSLPRFANSIGSFLKLRKTPQQKLGGSSEEVKMRRNALVGRPSYLAFLAGLTL